MTKSVSLRTIKTNSNPCVHLFLLVFISYFLKAPLRNFHFVMFAAVLVDKSGTAYCRKDFVWCEHLFQNIVKETGHLVAQYQFDHKHKMLKLSVEKYPPASTMGSKK